MTIHYRIQGQTLIVFGNTFHVKEQIKALGGRFNGSEKNWHLPASDTNKAAVSALCEGASGGMIPSAPASLTTPIRSSVGASQDKPGISVSELMAQIGMRVQQAFGEPIWVIGEIQNIATRKSGIFFELAEAQQQAGASTTVKTILWQGAKAGIVAKHGEKFTDVMQEGMQVRLLCRVSFYRDRGYVSLTLEDIDPSFTKGALALAREELLKSLRKKGLDRTNPSLPFPRFPLRVGLVSAKGSRAHSDFTHQLTSGGYPGTILFEASPMQGDAVLNGVKKAVANLLAKKVDVIVITRGGGSQADLRWFDTEEIALTVAHCPVPVIAAIGHHDDVCVAEEICYQRQKTPTAAAAFLLDVMRATKERVSELATKLANQLAVALDRAEDRQVRIEQGLADLALRTVDRHHRRIEHIALVVTGKGQQALHSAERSLTAQANRMLGKASEKVTNAAEALFHLEKKLTAKDPGPWLDRGWTQLTQEGRLVRSLDDVNEKTPMKARLRDGLLTLNVTSKEPANARKPKENRT